MKIYAVYNDGNHIACFNTLQEAHRCIESHYANTRYIEIEEEDLDPDCDCKNQNISFSQEEFYKEFTRSMGRPPTETEIKRIIEGDRS